MTPDQLFSRLSDVVLVDVRWQNEWDAGHIDGAVHIPMDELEDRVQDLPSDRPMVTICRTGNRSADAADVLVREGLQAENLEGGMVAWAEAGLAMRAVD